MSNQQQEQQTAQPIYRISWSEGVIHTTTEPEFIAPGVVRVTTDRVQFTIHDRYTIEKANDPADLTPKLQYEPPNPDEIKRQSEENLRSMARVIREELQAQPSAAD